MLSSEFSFPDLNIVFLFISRVCSRKIFERGVCAAVGRGVHAAVGRGACRLAVVGRGSHVGPPTPVPVLVSCWVCRIGDCNRMDVLCVSDCAVARGVAW